METTKKKKISADAAFLRLSSLCAAAEYCGADIKKKLAKWDLPEGEEDEKKIITRLRKERYIDDERFARSFVHDKFHYNRWGHVRIGRELRFRGIDDDTIANAISEIGEEDYDKTLRQLLESKRRTTKGKSEYEINMKLMRFALSRGFSMDCIRRCLQVEDGRIDTDM